MVVKVIIKDITTTLRDFKWDFNLNQKKIFFSFSIMINHEKQVLKNVREIFKFSDNRPEPPGLDLARTEKKMQSEKRCSLKRMHFEKDAVWKGCSLELKMQMHSSHSKWAVRSKRIIFLDHAPFYGNYEKTNKKSCFIFCPGILKSVACILKYFKSFLSN